jgi:hypothetical protein
MTVIKIPYHWGWLVTRNGKVGFALTPFRKIQYAGFNFTVEYPYEKASLTNLPELHFDDDAEAVIFKLTHL